ncbi:MAG: DUF6080 domain-containing protein [Prevotellaceae bacterium]|nr:DUF6080 domain-containing protein [Prevotellaceae bacterium]
MRGAINLFRIRREERWMALAALGVLLALNALAICAYYNVFTPVTDNAWSVFVKHFLISGYDPITYQVVTHWETKYNVYRHPLLAFFMYIPYLMNRGLTALTGINCAIFVVAALLVFCAFYAFIFLYRIFREVTGIGRFDAILLSALLFSFGHIMVSAIVPDHFIMSMFMLLLVSYVAGRKMRRQADFSMAESIALFVLTAGISLNNGIKVMLAFLFTNAKRLFRPKYLLFAVLLPPLLMWLLARWEYRVMVWPGEQARKVAKAKKDAQKKERDFKMFADTSGIKDKERLAAEFKKEQKKRMWAKYKADHKKPWNLHTGKPIAKGEFMNWTDISTSRWDTAVENLFGESIQLHQEHLLGDTLRSRPVIVSYNWVLNYVVEAIIVMLFFLGIVMGWRDRFLWMVLSCFALDMMLHVGLGFGINEVYIMAAHWLYVVPVAMGYLFKHCQGRWRTALRVLVLLLTVYLWTYNGILLTGFMVG